MTLHRNQEINNTSYEWIISKKELSQQDGEGLFSFVDYRGELFHYQLTGNPERIRAMFPSILHYLNHFWLLLPDVIQEQQTFWLQFYSLYSTNYLDLINPDHNLACIYYFKTLLNENAYLPPDFRILDYGCGPGLSTQIFGLKHLVGYDNNPTMLEKATNQGLEVLDKEGFDNIQSCSFDGSFASYVFHMAIPESDITNLARIVKSNGILVANYYKDLGIERVSSLLRKLGFEAKKMDTGERRFGSVYIYRKQPLFSSSR